MEQQSCSPSFISRVEARALERDRTEIEDTLHGLSALHALRQFGSFAHLTLFAQHVATVTTFVVVDWH